jgi:hypothetical protein
MALFHTRSAAIFGIDAHLIDVEVDNPGQNRDFITVGMPAIVSCCGYSMPQDYGFRRLRAASAQCAPL